MPDTKKYISQINVGAEIYTIKDAEARELINSISASGISYRGETTTELYDNLKTTTGLVAIKGQDVALANGNLVIYNDKEYIYLAYDVADEYGNVGEFNEFGSTGSLKALAFKDKVTVEATGSTNSTSEATVAVEGAVSGTAVDNHDYTPAGSINVSGGNLTGEITATFTGDVETYNEVNDIAATDLDSHSYTPAGTISKAEFVGTAEEHGHVVNAVDPQEGENPTYTPAGNINFTEVELQTAATDVNIEYTPAGTINDLEFKGNSVTPVFTGTAAEHNHDVTIGGEVKAYTPAGTVTTNVTTPNHDHTATIAWNENGAPVVAIVNGETLTFEAAFVPTATIAEKAINATATSTFSGDSVDIRVAEKSITPVGTIDAIIPAGTITKPVFTGTKATLTGNVASVNVIGNIAATFAGKGVRLVSDLKSLTPAGTIATQTFTGTAATLAHAGHTHTVNKTAVDITPSGKIAVANTLGVTGITATFVGDKATLTHNVTQGTVAASGTLPVHTHNVTVVGEGK